MYKSFGIQCLSVHILNWVFNVHHILSIICVMTMYFFFLRITEDRGERRICIPSDKCAIKFQFRILTLVSLQHNSCYISLSMWGWILSQCHQSCFLNLSDRTKLGFFRNCVCRWILPKYLYHASFKLPCM